MTTVHVRMRDGEWEQFTTTVPSQSIQYSLEMGIKHGHMIIIGDHYFNPRHVMSFRVLTDA